MATEVIDVPERSRYELLLDGELVGWADYRPLPDGRLALPYAQVDRARSGQGLGSALAAGVYADLAARGVEPVPTCGFMASRRPR
ncbi:MAG: putative acetyltransferase [Solirubrobacterales bacterium]|jgi:predicted GNAT family acetyltransferase|nr:putative acetyltransferase [Solirubrobacterales bacterium]